MFIPEPNLSGKRHASIHPLGLVAEAKPPLRRAGAESPSCESPGGSTPPDSLTHFLAEIPVGMVPKSSSRVVRIRLPTLLCSLSLGEPSLKKG